MSLQIIEWSDFLKADINSIGKDSEGAAMTIGVFDGVHLGHQALIERIVSRGPFPTAVTFRENPKKIISPEKYQGDIISLKQKLEVFEQKGVNRVILIDFSLEFSKLNGWDFLKLLEERGKMAFLAIGSNFRCGYQQDTGAEYIAAMNKKKGIPTEVIPPVTLPPEFGKEPVNSSRIRSTLINGDLTTAAALLGRRFELDISDLESGEQIYETGSVMRIIPPDGEYPVIVNPGKMKAHAIIGNGKLKLMFSAEPGDKAFKPARPAESLEFI